MNVYGKSTIGFPRLRSDPKTRFVAYALVFACANMAALTAAMVILDTMDLRAVPAFVIMACASLYAAGMMFKR